MKQFQQLQDDIAETVGFGLLTVDYKGIPITTHSKNCEFCKKIRGNPEFEKLCEKSDSRGGLESARLKKPFIYLCHMGLVDFAVPIIVEDNYLGAVLAGQVMIDNTEDSKKLERIFYDHEHLKILETDNNLKELYEAVPKLSLSRVETVANLILHFSNYLVEDAVLKASYYELQQEMSKLSSQKEYGNQEKRIFNNYNNGDDNKYIDARCIKYYKDNYNGNKKLKPAIDYIIQNPREKIYIEKMASFCNISVSYFSRLFKKELNMTFSRYVNMVKINEAKELLELTKLQIGEIAFNVGYEDAGYFIKIFKEHENETPAAYRKNYLHRVKNRIL